MSVRAAFGSWAAIGSNLTRSGVSLVVFSLLIWAVAMTVPTRLAAADAGANASNAPDLTRIVAAARERRPVKVLVVGDSLARGLWTGLYEAFRKTRDVKIIRRAKSATGLVRTDRYDWFRRANEIMRQDRPDAVVVMIGGNDRQAIRTGGKTLKRFTRPWQQAYLRRVASFAQTLRKGGTAVYWVGLPVVRSGRMERDYAMMNKIYAHATKARGARFIPTFHMFRDANGKYAAYGPDLRGRHKLLRKDDGLHFTMSGDRILGELVADLIRADVARGERIAITGRSVPNRSTKMTNVGGRSTTWN